MQRQQEKPQRQSPRSWGEVAVALLLLFWGIIMGLAGLLFFQETKENGALPLVRPTYLLVIVYSVLSCLGAVATLLRRRNLAKWFLWASALILLVVLGTGVLFCLQLWPNISPTQRSYFIRFVTLVGSVLLTLIMGAFFTGRWIGQQEDSEA